MSEMTEAAVAQALRLRALARKQIREEATEPITDYHKFEALVEERLAKLEEEEDA